jgi:multiple sugar transport system substrate-binding protein
MKRLVSLSLLVLLASFAFAQGKKDSGNTEVNVLMANAYFQVSEQQYIQEVLKPAIEAKTGLKVNFEFFPADEAEKKAKAEKASGKFYYDLVVAHSSRMPEYFGNALVADLASVMSNYKDRTYTNAFDINTKKAGKLYFVLSSADVYVTAINKKALPYIPAGLSEVNLGKLTWEQFVQWGINIKQGANGIAGQSVGKVVFPVEPMKQFIYMAGGMGLAYGEMAFPKVDGPKMEKVWNLLDRLGKADAFCNQMDTYPVCEEFLKNGSAWLSYGLMGPVGNAVALAPDQYLIAPAPIGDAGRGSISGAHGYALLAGAPNPQGAKKVLEFISTPANNYVFCKGIGGVISPIAEVKDLFGTVDVKEKIIKIAMEFMTASNSKVSGIPSVNYKDFNAVKAQFDSILESILKKTYTPAMLAAKETNIKGLLK